MTQPIPTLLPILLIEDEPAVMAYVRATLERNGYAVISAASGTEGLRRRRDWSRKTELLFPVPPAREKTDWPATLLVWREASQRAESMARMFMPGFRNIVPIWRIG